MVNELIFGALVATALLSAIGAFFLFISRSDFENIISYLISLSVGTIFGGVFLHLLFRLVNSSGYQRSTGLLILGGILGSYLLERGVHWHCHHADHDIEPFSLVLVAGDSIHNVLDGILIASSFLASTSAGLAAMIAVMFHKVPKELGDFGILVHAGFSRIKALLFNFGISLFMFLGAGLVIILSGYIDNAVSLLLPLVIGNFVYIAGSDLLPQIKGENEDWLKHVFVFIVGVSIMYAIPFIKAMV